MPLAFKPILGSVLAVGVSCAMLLHLLVHIGVSTQGECALDGAGDSLFGGPRGRLGAAIGRSGLAVAEAWRTCARPG